VTAGSKTLFRIADLNPHPQNPNRHSPQEVALIRQSLRKFGVYKPLVVWFNPEDKRWYTLTGHCVAEAAAQEGMGEVWVEDRSDLTSTQALALMAGDNEIARQLSYPDQDDLSQLIAAVHAEDESLAALAAGGEDELRRLLEMAGQEPMGAPEAQIDKGRELAEQYGTKVGQIWVLGRHKLAVGDCRDKALVAALMQGEKAGAVITDPPYGIEREGIMNDDPAGLRALYDGCLAAMPIADAVVIAFQSPRLFWVWLDAVRDAGHRIERMLWMYKPNDETFPWRGWLQKSEAIPVSSLGKPRWLDVHPYANDYYECLWGKAEVPKGTHASVKPLAVVQDLVSRVGGLVYDPFVGSGTTLIAAERLGRESRCLELSPVYAAVTIKRWEDATGGKPERVE